MHIPFARWGLTLSALCAFAFACTRADLFGIRQDPSLPDKITLSGTVCTDNPLERRFPVKVIFLVDGSVYGSVATGSVINQFRTQALSDVFNLYGGAAEISFSVVKFDGDTESLTLDEYTRDLAILQNAATRAGLPCSASNPDRCNQRRYELALERAENLITGDLLVTPKGTRARTRYVIVLYAEGPRIGLVPQSQPDAGPIGPPPVTESFFCNALCDEEQDDARSCRPEAHCIEGCHFEREIRRMREYVVDNGAADLVVHTAHFLTQPLPTDLSCCGPPAPDNQCEAQAVLSRIAAAGGGAYVQFKSPGEVSFRPFEYAATNNVFVMKNLIAVNLNAKPTPDGLKPDSDADGLDDDDEIARGTQPLRADTDGDGLGDYLEVLLKNQGLDALTAQQPDQCVNLPPLRDTDGDGLTDCEESLLGTDATLFDSDSDGYPDRIELMYGTNYLVNDADRDNDVDGQSNAEELKQHTDPRSNDAKTRGELAYLYRIIPQGITTLLDIQQPRAISGVTVREVTSRVYPGVSILQYSRTNGTLSWRDYQDTQFGPAVNVSTRGIYRLHTQTSVPDDPGQDRSIVVEVIPELLPPRDLAETLQVRETQRQCVDWRVRNITLAHTARQSDVERLQGQRTGDATMEGLNRILVYFAETPRNAPLGPGLFRVAPVELVFIPPRYKYPDVAELPVEDPDFVLLGESATTP